MKIIAYGIPFLASIIIIGGAFQGTGNAFKSMNIILLMNVIYTILSYIFIFGKFGVQSFGLKGAAIAMVIAQLISAIIAVYSINVKKGILKGCLNNISLKLDFNLIKKVYFVGISASLESILWLIAIIIVTAVILDYGPITFATYQVATNAEAISYMPAFGFGVAATTLISQAIGAKDNNLAKVYLVQMIKGVILLTSLSVIAFIVAPEKIIMVLTNNEEVIKLGGKYLFIMAFVQIPLNLYGLFIGALRGMRIIGIPIMISVVGLWCIRIPLILISVYYFKVSVLVSWVIIGVDILFRFILSAYFLKKKIKNTMFNVRN